MKIIINHSRMADVTIDSTVKWFRLEIRYDMTAVIGVIFNTFKTINCTIEIVEVHFS